jgi:hypothetical protein
MSAGIGMLGEDIVRKKLDGVATIRAVGHGNPEIVQNRFAFGCDVQSVDIGPAGLLDNSEHSFDFIEIPSL